MLAPSPATGKVAQTVRLPVGKPTGPTVAFVKNLTMMADRVNRVLGIDPGLNITGYGVLECRGRKLAVCEAGVVRGGSSKRLLAERLKTIHQGIADVIKALRPDVVAIEELYSHYARPRTAILMGHARGVICLAAAEAGIPVTHYSATQIKRILTGSGRASKEQVQRAIQHELGLASPPEPPDVADALAIAVCHHYLRGTAEMVAASEKRGHH